MPAEFIKLQHLLVAFLGRLAIMMIVQSRTRSINRKSPKLIAHIILIMLAIGTVDVLANFIGLDREPPGCLGRPGAPTIFRRLMSLAASHQGLLLCMTTQKNRLNPSRAPLLALHLHQLFLI